MDLECDILSHPQRVRHFAVQTHAAHFGVMSGPRIVAERVDVIRSALFFAAIAPGSAQSSA